MHPLYKILKNTKALRGLNGIVWHARDEVLDRDVALKELRSWASRPPRAGACFQFAHIRQLTLSHPGLVPVHGVDCDRGWLVLDYYPQGSLAGQEDAMPPAAVRRVLADVLRTLAYLHAAGFVHGAIKPANLFVPAEGPVLTSDGLGLRLDAARGVLAAKSGVFSTFDSLEGKYLAPECLDGKEDRVGPPADVYALGWTALELLLGGTWFSTLFPLIRIKAQRWGEWHASDEVVAPLRQVSTDVPGDLADLVDWMIRKDPAERPTVAGVLSALGVPAEDAVKKPAPAKNRPAWPKRPRAPEAVTPAPAVPTPVVPRAVIVPPAPAPRNRLWVPAALGGSVAGMALGACLSLNLRTPEAPHPDPLAPPPVVVVPKVTPAVGPAMVPRAEAEAHELAPRRANRELFDRQNELAEAQARIDGLKQEAGRLAADLQKAQADFQTSQGDLKKSLSDLRTSQAEIQKAVAEGEGQRRRADRLVGELKLAREESARAAKEGERLRAAAADAAAESKGVRESLARALTEVQEQKALLAKRPVAKGLLASPTVLKGVDKHSVPLVLGTLKDLGAKIEVDAQKPDQPVIKVDLEGSAITNGQLVLLEQLPTLRTLSLSSTVVGDSGLSHIAKLTNLESLNLYDTNVSDAGLVHLEKLKSLKVLYLSSTRVGNAGMIHLRGLGELQTLSLANTAVTDAGLSHISGAGKLQHLSLATTGVTDSGLVHLQKMAALRTLRLAYTQVTDSGLPRLKGLPELGELHLSFSRVTANGVKELAKELPRRRIQHESLGANGVPPR